MKTTVLKKDWLADGKQKLADGKAKLTEGKQKIVSSTQKFIEEHPKIADTKAKLVESTQLLAERKTKIVTESKQAIAEKKENIKAVLQQGLQRKPSKDSILEAISPDYDLPIGRNIQMEVKTSEWEWYDHVEDEYKKGTAMQCKKFKLECNTAGCCKEVRIVPSKQVGAASLQKYVMKSMLDNVKELTAEAVEWLPKHLALEAFHLIMSRGAMTFALWKCFQSVLQGEKVQTMAQLHYRQSIPDPKIGLSDYVRVLSSTNMDHLVHLSITARFPINAYVRLADLKNLGILEIVRVDLDRSSTMVSSDNRFQGYEPEPPNLDDRVVRAWSEMVVSDGAFPVLRILKLWYHRYITNRSVKYVANFPSLAIFDVRGCGCVMDIKKRGELKYGWLSTYKADHLAFLEDACVKRLRLVKEACDPNDPEPVRVGILNKVQGIAADDEDNDRSTSVDDVSRTSPYPIATDAPVRVISRKDVITAQINNTLQYQLKRQAPLTWDHHDFTAFAKIGELRRDKDLQKHGLMDSDDQTFVGDQLVSPIPMASLRLGPNIDHLYPRADDPMNEYFEKIAIQNSQLDALDPSHIGPPIIPITHKDPRLLEAQVFFYAMSFYRIKLPQKLLPRLICGQAIKRKAEKAIMKVKKLKTPNQFDFMP